MRRIGLGLAIAGLFLTTVGVTWNVAWNLATRDVVPPADPPVTTAPPEGAETEGGSNWMGFVGFAIIVPGFFLALMAMAMLSDHIPELIELWKIKLTKKE